MTLVRAIDSGSGDTIFWILLTVLLMLYVTRSVTMMLLSNPLYIGLFIVAIIIIYIVISALNLAYGISNEINSQIVTLSEVLK